MTCFFQWLHDLLLARGSFISEMVHVGALLESALHDLQGLGAPVGSIVAGPKAFIDRVFRYRKMLGGGMRQCGVLAAPGSFPRSLDLPPE